MSEDFVSQLVRELIELRSAMARAGGASATYSNGKLIICHPDMPPHVWDGEKMERVQFHTPEQSS